MRSTSRTLLIFIAMSIVPVLPACGPGNAGTRPYEELREKLMPEGRPIGQPLSRKQTDIRIVRVDSRAEADSIFSGLCLGLPVARRTYDGEEWLTCRMPPHYGGELHYTHRPLHGWRVAGTVYVRSPELNRWGFTEIRFVETVKVKSK